MPVNRFEEVFSVLTKMFMVMDRLGIDPEAVEGAQAWLEPIVRETETELRALEHRCSGDQRTALFLKMLSDLAQEAIRAANLPCFELIKDPALPAVFGSISGERGAQVAANMLAMEMVLADLSGRLSAFIDARTKTEVERVVSEWLAKEEAACQDDACQTALIHIDYLRLHIEHAKDFLGHGGAEGSIVRLTEGAHVATRRCRKKLPWPIRGSFAPMIREELGIKLGFASGELTDGKAYCIARIEMLLHLAKEVEQNLRVLAWEEGQEKTK